ncbi:MAG: zinc-binding dehydrogenase [Planctomycetes bacterium]|jgi:NADPH:quinone reductase-like Zn-dependent oxidoreductase|nr:zinc-binding dehydrogenase [Planctomycetota bacterium]
MKAAVITEFGDIDKLEVIEIDEPTAAPGEVVLEVRAAALNHVDIWIRKGAKQQLDLPWTPGSDAAGTVAAVGEGVEHLSIGDDVVLNAALDRLSPQPSSGRGNNLTEGIVGMSRPGTFAERVAVPAWTLHPKPTHLSYDEAAALALDHITAWRMVVSRAQLLAGETVLIHGIGGGLALAALQLATLIGARAIVTSSSDEKLKRAADLGADVGINYETTDDVAQTVLAATDDHGVDVAVDSVGAATWPINVAAVRPGGRIVHCGVTTGAEVTASIQDLYWKQLSVLGSTMGSQEEFGDMLRAVEAAMLRPVIDGTYPLDDIRKATARLEAGEQFGKIVIEML